MKLEIFDDNDELPTEFGIWIVGIIKDNIALNLNPSKLSIWDKFFNSTPEYKSIYSGVDVETVKFIDELSNMIVVKKIPGKFIIEITPNRYVSGLDRIRASSLAKLINFGNLSIRGYPIFTDVFKEVADNINDYVERFYTGVF